MSLGGSKSSGDNRFERTGTATTSSWRDLSPANGLFNNAFNATQPGAANGAVDGSLVSRMGLTLPSTPYQPELCKIIRSNIPDVAQPGYSSLTAQSQVNPYSSSYADNSFNRYAEEMQRAMSMARSGPVATRGGTAAQGFVQAEVANDMGRQREDMLQRNRQVDATISQSASQQLGQGRAQMNQTALSGIQSQFGNFYNLLQDKQGASTLASERLKMYDDLVPQFAQLASQAYGTESNNLRGYGMQASQSMGAGLNLCCFIFLEAYHGKLPNVVRRYRDEKAPENSARRRGYIRMSKWLVPAMRVSVVARTLVGCLLTRPLTSYGKWYYGEGKVGVVFKPVEAFWMKVWEKLGKNEREYGVFKIN